MQAARLAAETEPEPEVVKKKSKTQYVNSDREVTPKSRGRPRKQPKLNDQSIAASTFTTTDESSSSSDSSAVHRSPYKVDNLGSSMESIDSTSRHSSAKVNGAKVVKTNSNCLYSGMNGNGVVGVMHHSTDESDEKLIGARRRKRNVPKKSNGGVTKGELVF